MIRKSMPSGLTRRVETGFPSRQTRNAFARRSCSNKELEHDVGSTLSHHALVPRIAARSRIFLVALQKLDRNALRATDEADPHPGPDCRRLLGELDALGLDLGGNRVEVLHRHPQLIDASMWLR